MNPEYFTLITSLFVALTLGVLVVVLLLCEIKALNTKLEQKDKQIADMWERVEQPGPRYWEA